MMSHVIAILSRFHSEDAMNNAEQVEDSLLL
jgi:hypothetical protein